MASIGVVTDSTSDMSPEHSERYGVVVVPLVVNWDGQTFRDKLDLSTHDFYQRLRTGKSMPKTGAPSLAAFETAFREQLKQHDAVISVNVSAKLSGTYDIARKAAASVDPRRITVVDSGSVSICLGWLAEMAATWAREGVEQQTIVERLEEVKGRMRILALVETLDYLQRGGRLGRAAALAGTLLSVKPILSINNGEVAPLERVRTMNGALRRLVQLVVASGTPARLGVMDADSAANADEVEHSLRAHHPGMTIDRGELGPVVGTHGGPGVVGVGLLVVR